MSVYLDNAAATLVDDAVIEVMMPILKENFGNPSSIHSFGRQARSVIEKARKTVANLMNVSPAELFFTSGGTEANNMILSQAVQGYGITEVISSPLEHHAVLHTLEEMMPKVNLHFVDLDEKGHVDLKSLEKLLQKYPKALVSLMHANNEIGNLLPIEEVAQLCQDHNALFHSDTVQTWGHFPLDFQKIKVDFAVGAAHKFHGPKGIGMAFVRSTRKIKPFIHGGGQERNMRGGTENILGIVGFAKALEVFHEEYQTRKKEIESLKELMSRELIQKIEGVQFNGDCLDFKKSLYTILSVSLPPFEAGDMLLFNLDIEKIAVSSGSACTSGSELGSHVIRALKTNPDRITIRFSFSKYNTKEEILYVCERLSQLVKKNEG